MEGSEAAETPGAAALAACFLFRWVIHPHRPAKNVVTPPTIPPTIAPTFVFFFLLEVNELGRDVGFDPSKVKDSDGIENEKVSDGIEKGLAVATEVEETAIPVAVVGAGR